MDVYCKECNHLNDATQDYCEKCGEAVSTPPNDPQVMEGYFNNYD